jgi:hypothetical protein
VFCGVGCCCGVDTFEVVRGHGISLWIGVGVGLELPFGRFLDLRHR